MKKASKITTVHKKCVCSIRVGKACSINYKRVSEMLTQAFCIQCTQHKLNPRFSKRDLSHIFHEVGIVVKKT